MVKTSKYLCNILKKCYKKSGNLSISAYYNSLDNRIKAILFKQSGGHKRKSRRRRKTRRRRRKTRRRRRNVRLRNQSRRKNKSQRKINY